MTSPSTGPSVDARTDHRDGSLDALRGLAILLVLASHAHLPHAAQLGGAGVTVFFVLSGYLITSILVRDQGRVGRISLGRFYARRALRLLPALVVMLAVLSLAAVSTWSAWWPSALASVLYVANWVRVADPAGFHPALDHAWTLAVEEQYYLLWPLVLIAFRRRGRAFLLVLVAAAAASVAVRLALWPSWHAQLGSDANAYGLLVGSALALVPLRRSALWTRIGALVVLSGVLMPASMSGPVAALGALALIAGAVPAWSPLVGAGRISYGLYLWHLPVLSTMVLVGRPEPVRALVLYPVAFVLAFASYRFVEQPFLRLKDRRFAAPRGTAADRIVQPVRPEPAPAG